MHTVIRHPAGRDFADMESAVARLLDVMLIGLGAALASLLCVAEPAHALVEASFVAFDMALALILLPWFGVYDSWRGRPKWRLSVCVVAGWLAVQASGLAVMFLLHRTASLSRLWCVSWTALTAGGLVASRLLVHAVLARMRRAGRNLRTVAVMGAGRHRDGVLANLAASPQAGFRAVAVCETGCKTGCKTDCEASCEAIHEAGAHEGEVGGRGAGQREACEGQAHAAGLPVFHAFREFADWVRREQVDEIWLALPISEEATLIEVVAEFSGDLVNVRFLPDVRGLVMFDRHVVDLLGSPAINLVASPMTPYSLLQKALFDRLFAAAVLVVLAPLMLFIALAVKMTSKGPVLFTQRRKGANGRVFRIYKFRSMRLHAQAAGVVRQATRRDPRVTRVGAFLRRTSLDELPQFFNVLRGDMSVVGPRPHAIEHDDQYRSIVDGYIHRYRIKPGITGWAQVNGFRGETDRIEKMQRRVEHDLYYLRNWSFGLDMRIVAATVVKGFLNRNAY